MAAGTYRTIVADPPWNIGFTRYGIGGMRRNPTVVPYSYMSLDEIKLLPISDLAADECHLYLWSTRRLFREGVAASVARSWGFEPCGEIVWGLRNPGPGGPLGNGHEPVLLARKGTTPYAGTVPTSVVFWRQQYGKNGQGKLHSAKPEGFLDLVESLSPGPYLELFARRQRLGWDTWGNEALGHVEMAS
jgi:N6-adenosine-specific RNA methylase IME4